MFRTMRRVKCLSAYYARVESAPYVTRDKLENYIYIVCCYSKQQKRGTAGKKIEGY